MQAAKLVVEERGVAVDAASAGGDTALTLAACRGHLDVVQYLAGERGAAVDHAQADGATALIAAACNGYLDVVRYLAGERGAAVDYLGNNANFSQKRSDDVCGENDA